MFGLKHRSDVLNILLACDEDLDSSQVFYKCVEGEISSEGISKCHWIIGSEQNIISRVFIYEVPMV